MVNCTAAVQEAQPNQLYTGLPGVNIKLLFTQHMVQSGTVASEKIRFEFLYVHDLGPRSRDDLDLEYSLTFINSLRCLLLPTFRSLAAIVSEKSTVFTFYNRKAYVTKFDLTIK